MADPRTRWAVPVAALLFAVLVGAIAPPAAAQGGAISAGDLLYIDVYRRPELSTTAPVDADGNIRMPYVGKVSVGGRSTAQASSAIALSLRRILRDKSPSVTVTRAAAKPSAPNVARAEEMVTDLIEIENLMVEELGENLLGMTTEGGSISANTQANCLIVTDTKVVVEKIKQAVKMLDQLQAQQTQVHINTKIAEVKVGAMKEMGVRWFIQGAHTGGGYNPMPGQDTAISALGGSSNTHNDLQGGNNVNSGGSGFGQVRQFITDGIGNELTGGGLDRRLNIPLQVAGPGQLSVGYRDQNVDVGVMLNALMADDKAELLAEPQVLTINHQRSDIEMLDEFPFTEVGYDISGRSISSVRFLDLGIKMGVTPHVARGPFGTHVVLDLEPEVSFPSGMSQGVPIRSVRSYTGKARVANGQTLVIGGIYRTDLHKVNQRVPVLGAIPLIGHFFKHTENSKSKTELMIFVTPTVHDSPETVTWDEMLDITASSEVVGPEIASLHTKRKTPEE